jgi:glycosyltransferase involved in cell wall biosynthesis
VLYVFTARKRGLLERAARGEMPDTLLFGFNHLAAHGIEAHFYEPDYGRAGRALARQLGRFGPDLLQLRTLPHFRQVDVVFLTGAWPLLLAAQAIPAPRRPKLVWLNLSLTNLLRAGGPLRPLIRRAIRQADRIVCVARFQQDFLRHTLGLDEHRLPLVRSGTDDRFFCPPPGPHTGAAPAAAPYVLAAGRDAARDYRTLVEATRGAPYATRIVCSPASVAGLSLPTGVTVRYDIPPAALRDEYHGAAAVAVPTLGDSAARGSDCSGTLVLLDALAMGRPSVITSRASVSDYIVPGEHALCVPPEDPAALRAALDRLVSDPEYAQRLAAAGREHVRGALTTRHFAARLAEVFHEVCGTSAPRCAASTVPA